MKADFYYLTRTPLDRALPAIAERVLAGGDRLEILADDPEFLDRLDRALWAYRPDSFLPHGREGAQLVLLTCPKERPATYANLAYVDGVWRDPAADTARIFYFFDADTLDNARSAWRAINTEAFERRYWKQTDEGRWIEGP